MDRKNRIVAIALVGLALAAVGATGRRESVLNLTLRYQKETARGSGLFHTVHEEAKWDAQKTAIIICDMWDKHWCEASTLRVGEMAPAMNEVVKSARERGVLIVHCPSETMGSYKDSPQRKRAQDAPKASPPSTQATWQGMDPAKEPKLPIDDSDGGCDSGQKPWYRAWKREIAAIEIAPEDAITDNGDEVYNLLQQRRIDNLIVMGVHTNMCVLGRSFAIRRMVKAGKNVVLMRDMTDTMYNPAMAPHVSHFRGTDLVIEHIEKYWCPSITSTVFTGKPAFRFPADKRPHVAALIAEDEYNARETVPAFLREELADKLGFRCTVVASDSKTDVPGLDTLRDADALIVYARRRTLPPEQLAQVKAYVASGKPIIGLRTASHAFQNWLEFDKEVLGGSYHGHHNNKAETGEPTKVQFNMHLTDHPILVGIPSEFESNGTLYMTSPLNGTVQPLLYGRITGKEPLEPVAWIRTDGGRRVFYTSLGHPDDFKLPAFRRLLVNAVKWCLNRPAITSE